MLYDGYRVRVNGAGAAICAVPRPGCFFGHQTRKGGSGGAEESVALWRCGRSSSYLPGRGGFGSQFVVPRTGSMLTPILPWRPMNRLLPKPSCSDGPTFRVGSRLNSKIGDANPRSTLRTHPRPLPRDRNRAVPRRYLRSQRGPGYRSRDGHSACGAGYESLFRSLTLLAIQPGGCAARA